MKALSTTPPHYAGELLGGTTLYVDETVPCITISPIPDAGTRWNDGPRTLLDSGTRAMFECSCISTPAPLGDVTDAPDHDFGLFLHDVL